jgi:hypothetical protein
MARVRCGELCAAKVTRNSVLVTSKSAALAKRPQRRETHARIHVEGQFFGDMTLDLADCRAAVHKKLGYSG